MPRWVWDSDGASCLPNANISADSWPILDCTAVDTDAGTYCFKLCDPRGKPLVTQSGNWITARVKVVGRIQIEWKGQEPEPQPRGMLDAYFSQKFVEIDESAFA